jgi:cytochrome bd-type quinol oxidase subunit 1
MENGAFVPNDWTRIIFNSVVWSRFPHMLFASYLAGAFCVALTGACQQSESSSSGDAPHPHRHGA